MGTPEPRLVRTISPSLKSIVQSALKSSETVNKQSQCRVIQFNHEEVLKKSCGLLQTFSLAMVTHIIQQRVQKLPTSPIRPFVVDIHVRRHPKRLLTHILTVPLHLLVIAHDPPLRTRLRHPPRLPVEMQPHVLRAEEIVVHGKAHFVVIAMGRRVRWVVTERSRITVPNTCVGVPPFLSSPGTPLRISLAYLFLFCPRKCLADVGAVIEPIVVVATNVGSFALVSLVYRLRQAHVVDNKGSVRVVVVVFVLEDVSFFELEQLFGVDG